MRRIREARYDELIPEFLASGKPVLGICLGMQVLFESSSEHEGAWGLGLLQGRDRTARRRRPEDSAARLERSALDAQLAADRGAPESRLLLLRELLLGARRQPRRRARRVRLRRGVHRGRRESTRSTARSSTPRSRAPTACACWPTSRRICVDVKAGVSAVILFPAVDIRDGTAVRLTQGDYDREQIYNDDPLAAAEDWVGAGCDAPPRRRPRRRAPR